MQKNCNFILPLFLVSGTISMAQTDKPNRTAVLTAVEIHQQDAAKTGDTVDAQRETCVDEPSISEAAGAIWESQGYEVLTVADGVDALNALNRAPARFDYFRPEYAPDVRI